MLRELQARRVRERGQALERCRQIVDDYLATALRPGMSPTEPWKTYPSVGNAAAILAADAPAVRFSGWGYARARCDELACAASSLARTAKSSMKTPSPLEQASLSVRASVLQAWVHDALEAYKEATILLGHTGELGRLRAAGRGAIETRLLEPSHDALMRRYADEVTDGRQGVLFSTDPEADLQRRWARFAVGYMGRRGGARLQRLILQAAVGLCGGLDRTAAANSLFAHVLDAALPED